MAMHRPKSKDEPSDAGSEHRPSREAGWGEVLIRCVPDPVSHFASLRIEALSPSPEGGGSSPAGMARCELGWGELHGLGNNPTRGYKETARQHEVALIPFTCEYIETALHFTLPWEGEGRRE